MGMKKLIPIFIVLSLSLILVSASFGYDNPSLPRIEPPEVTTSSSSGGGTTNLTNVALTNQSNSFTGNQNIAGNLNFTGDMNGRPFDYCFSHPKGGAGTDFYLNVGSAVGSASNGVFTLDNGKITSIRVTDTASGMVSDGNVQVQARVNGTNKFSVTFYRGGNGAYTASNITTRDLGGALTSNSILTAYVDYQTAVFTSNNIIACIGGYYD